MCMSLYSCLSYPACNSHLLCAKLCCHLWLVSLYHILFTKQKIYILIFSTNFSWNISDSKKNSARSGHKFTQVFIQTCGPGSSVGIETDYRLDGPGIEFQWGARFSVLVQTGPGAHPASYTMGTGSFLEVKNGRGMTLTTHPLLVPWSWKSRAIPLLPLWAVRSVQSLSACTGGQFTAYFYSNLNFFFDRFFGRPSNNKFYENPFHAYRQTDGQSDWWTERNDGADSRCSQFCERAFRKLLNGLPGLQQIL